MGPDDAVVGEDLEVASGSSPASSRAIEAGCASSPCWPTTSTGHPMARIGDIRVSTGYVTRAPHSSPASTRRDEEPLRLLSDPQSSPPCDGQYAGGCSATSDAASPSTSRALDQPPRASHRARSTRRPPERGRRGRQHHDEALKTSGSSTARFSTAPGPARRPGARRGVVLPSSPRGALRPPRRRSTAASRAGRTVSTKVQEDRVPSRRNQRAWSRRSSRPARGRTR